MSSELDEAVAARLAAMPVARLAHFTPSKNLPNIIRDGMLRSVKDLSADVRACYTPTDLLRLDGFREKVCCSLQFPNGYYFARARTERQFLNYPDWVCLLMDKTVAAKSGTLFCPRNAASTSGACSPGVAGLESCYAPAVTGQGGITRQRGPQHDPGSPTDVQAEVLVTAPILLSAVTAIVVPTEAAAIQEHARLVQLTLPPPSHIQWKICPQMFEKLKIADAMRYSAYFAELPWTPTIVASQ